MSVLLSFFHVILCFSFLTTLFIFFHFTLLYYCSETCTFLFLFSGSEDRIASLFFHIVFSWYHDFQHNFLSQNLLFPSCSAFFQFFCQLKTATFPIIFYNRVSVIFIFRSLVIFFSYNTTATSFPFPFLHLTTSRLFFSFSSFTLCPLHFSPAFSSSSVPRFHTFTPVSFSFLRVYQTGKKIHIFFGDYVHSFYAPFFLFIVLTSHYPFITHQLSFLLFQLITFQLSTFSSILYVGLRSALFQSHISITPNNKMFTHLITDMS